MTDHLPECYDALIPDFHNERWVCICSALRACEQRVRGEKFTVTHYASMAGDKHFYRVGYAAGLDAALEAVERCRTDLRGYLDKTDALATIDALRQGEQ